MAIAYASVGFEVTLLTAIGQYLESKGIGKWTGPYGALDTPIAIDALASTPDRGIALTLYPVADTGGTGSTVGLQVRFRGPAGNRSAVKNIADNTFDALHGLEHITWGGIPIIRVWRQSGVYIGTDANNRSESTANYYIELIRSGTNRSD